MNSAVSGLVSSTAASTIATTAIQKNTLMTRAMRNRVQSLNRRWDQRSNPPKTFFVQKWW